MPSDTVVQPKPTPGTASPPNTGSSPSVKHYAKKAYQ
jgi:hypothetical protein